MRSSAPHRRRRGYSLVELLVALGILSAGVGAASALSLTMARQDEIGRHRMRILNLAENISTLWQLGVNPASVLLVERDVGAEGSNVSWTLSDVTATPIVDTTQGIMETTTLTIYWTAPGASGTSSRTFNLIRPQSTHR